MRTVTLPGVGVNDDTPRARQADPLTSHAAADAADLLGSQQLVYAIFEKLGHGIPDHELVDWAAFFGTAGARLRRYSPQRLRTARAELVEKGLIRDSGRVAPTEYGRDAVIWELVREDVAA